MCICRNTNPNRISNSSSRILVNPSPDRCPKIPINSSNKTQANGSPARIGTIHPSRSNRIRGSSASRGKALASKLSVISDRLGPAARLGALPSPQARY